MADFSQDDLRALHEYLRIAEDSYAECSLVNAISNPAMAAAQTESRQDVKRLRKIIIGMIRRGG